MPISSSQIKAWTDTDGVLSRVRCWTLEGWPERDQKLEMDNDLAPYFQRRWELSVEGGCVLWGCRVVVPKKGHTRALEMLHKSHPGTARMKSLARSYIWWPGLDREIERHVKKCVTCQVARKDPPVVPLHPWTPADKPWSHIHIDYAGPMEGNKMFLLMVDAHSRWLEIYPTSSATSAAIIELLRRSFASLGLPEVVVSDNATTFTSSEFSEFLAKNGVRHVTTPP